MDNAIPSSVLIILLGSVGDIARGAAVATHLKLVAPKTKIGWVVSKRFATLLHQHRAIDALYEFDEKHFLQSLFCVTKQLRSARYQVVLDLQRIAKSGIISFLSGAHCRYGFHKENSKEGNVYFQTDTIPHQDELRDGKLSLYLSFLRKIHVPPPEGAIEFGFDVDPTFQHPVLSQKFVAVILSSRWKTKDWPVEGYKSVVAQILQSHPDTAVVLVGAGGDAQRAEQVIAHVGEAARIVNLVGQTSLRHLPSLLLKARVVFGSDSGPLHIASAVHTPYVTVFGPTAASKVHPYQNMHNCITTPLGCSGCYRRQCDELGALCMRLISPSSVYQKIAQYL